MSFRLLETVVDALFVECAATAGLHPACIQVVPLIFGGELSLSAIALRRHQRTIRDLLNQLSSSLMDGADHHSGDCFTAAFVRSDGWQWTTDPISVQNLLVLGRALQLVEVHSNPKADYPTILIHGYPLPAEKGEQT